MGGLILALDRRGEPVADAGRLAAALGPHGTAGSATGQGWFLAWGPSAGSVRCAGPIHVAFDGRLDNADELRLALGADPAPPFEADSRATPDGAQEPPATEHADAALVLAAYRRWGDACWERLLGPFAVFVLDSGRGRVLFARDALGDRTVIYRVTSRLVLAATDEELLLDHPDVSDAVDEATEARFFGLLAAAPGHTFFRDLRELEPGSAMTVEPFGAASPRFRRHWSPEWAEPVRYRRDEEYAEHFRSVLDEAVRARLGSAPGEAPPAVLMSGGLDSTAVAALVGRRLAQRGERLSTVSWVFDELDRADEREFMEPAVEALGARPVWIRGDGEWPLLGVRLEQGAEQVSCAVGRGGPYAAIYRRLRDRSYAAVAGGGGRVLLTGECGDQLFLGGEEWLADLVAERRLRTALAEVGRGLGRAGRDDRFGMRASLGAVARRWGLLAAGRGGRSHRGNERPWLTPAARELIAAGAEEGVGEPPSVRRPAQASALVDPRIGAAARREAAFARTAADRPVELRRPYRDRRLVELALALPAHQLHRPGRSKWLTRRAMAGLLPESVLRRRRRSSLYPLFRRGVAERERATAQALLDSPRARWSRYVRSEWLRGFYPHGVSTEIDGADALVLWQCLSLELWRRRLAGGSLPFSDDPRSGNLAG